MTELPCSRIDPTSSHSAQIVLSDLGTAESFGRWVHAEKICLRSPRQIYVGGPELATNGGGSLDMKHLSVRPELSRRAPIEFLQV